MGDYSEINNTKNRKETYKAIKIAEEEEEEEEEIRIKKPKIKKLNKKLRLVPATDVSPIVLKEAQTIKKTKSAPTKPKSSKKKLIVLEEDDEEEV